MVPRSLRWQHPHGSECPVPSPGSPHLQIALLKPLMACNCSTTATLKDALCSPLPLAVLLRSSASVNKPSSHSKGRKHAGCRLTDHLVSGFYILELPIVGGAKHHNNACGMRCRCEPAECMLLHRVGGMLGGPCATSKLQNLMRVPDQTSWYMRLA